MRVTNMQIDETNLDALVDQYAEKHPRDVLQLAFESFDRVAIGFSGAEDVVLIDMAVRLGKAPSVFCLDTGRLHPETYQFIEKVRAHYDLDLELLFPDAQRVESLVQLKGLYSFRVDGHQECCRIRKVGPLGRKLRTLNAWITGQRRDQSPDTRSSIGTIEFDHGTSTPDGSLFKFNPLANWTSSQVWDYIRGYDVPYNPLHDRGFKSVGCEPCTRAVLPNQHEREGRWWWEASEKKECGLHGASSSAG